MQAIDETLILDEIHLEETLEAGKLDSYQIRWNKMDHGHPLLFSAKKGLFAFILLSLPVKKISWSK